jgi:hypothetical protein
VAHAGGVDAPDLEGGKRVIGLCGLDVAMECFCVWVGKFVGMDG